MYFAAGGESEIKEIRNIRYEDTVYNFLFEEADEGAYLAADGFRVGDLKMQNTFIDQRKKKG